MCQTTTGTTADPFNDVYDEDVIDEEPETEETDSEPVDDPADAAPEPEPEQPKETPEEADARLLRFIHTAQAAFLAVLDETYTQDRPLRQKQTTLYYRLLHHDDFQDLPLRAKKAAIALGVTFIFVVLGLGFWGLTALGREMAQGQDYFPVYMLPSSTSEVAVIRTYGDYLLAVPFTRDTEDAAFERTLVLVKMADSKTPLSLALEKIGPLRAKPSGTTPHQP